ncbi:odorant receptor 131-2-like [Scleropages formosus]|uniref:odorant receptor 131-2-like n=1 Tax=Scleropages formosus TaxID=113540 RepID=UPI0010FA76B8|nr:odorant receptor 131-2-like [Scleropages formosus]
MDGANGSSLQLDFLYQATRVQSGIETLMKATVLLSVSISFIYLNSIMFLALRSRSSFSEMSRYILFSQMLINDSILLMITSLLYSLALVNLTLTKAVCSLFVMVSAVSFNVSPLNLAVMSLERYVAICFPLHHPSIATPGRTKIVIVVIWLLSSVNFLIEIFFSAVSDPYFLTGHVYCTREQLFVAKWQYDMCQGFNSFFFVTVGITIIYTYGGIMVAARSIKAQKASRTVLLHLIQLGLCLTSFLYGTIERALAVFSSSLFINLRYLNFLFILLLPRCLSPLIYGLRDESVRSVFFCYLRCSARRTKPITIH